MEKENGIYYFNCSCFDCVKARTIVPALTFVIGLIIGLII